MRKLITYGLAAIMALVLLAGTAVELTRPAAVVEANAGTNWNASYYNNTTLSGNPVLTRVDDKIDFNWAAGSPDGNVPADNFSVRWTKTVNFPSSGKWHFKVGADDGIRMWIDVTQIVDQWHGNATGYATYEVDLDALTAGNHDLKVEYYEATGNAGVQVAWWQAGSTQGGGGGTGGTAGWTGYYFNNGGLSGTPLVTRAESKIAFNWGTGSPDGAIPADNFSARWTATVNFPTPGNWHFKITADDGVRLWIDVTPIIDQWHGPAAGVQPVYEADVTSLTAGNHELKVEYFEATGNAFITVEWWSAAGGSTSGGGTAAATAIPTPPPVKPIWAAATADHINVRTGPGRGYPVITQIFYPDNYRVTAAVPDMSWVQIEIDKKSGNTGWVSNEWVWLFSDEENFVDKIPRIDIEVAPPASVSEEARAQAKTLTGAGTTASDIKMRDGASAWAKHIATLPPGSVMLVEARNGNGAWYLVSSQGLRGWVSALNVKLIDGMPGDLIVSTEVVPAPPPGQIFVPLTENGTPATVRGRAKQEVKVRDAASVRGKELATLAENTEFLVVGRNTNGAWYLINYDGGSGWVSSPFVSLIEGTYYDLPIR